MATFVVLQLANANTAIKAILKIFNLFMSICFVIKFLPKVMILLLIYIKQIPFIVLIGNKFSL